MNILHIDSSVLGPHSISRQISAAIVDRLRHGSPSIQVLYRDLTETPLVHLSGAHLAAARGAPVPEELEPDLVASSTVLEEFLAAEVVVIGAPMYNFTLPSQLKAWIDRILVAGKTFRYGASGPEGLAGDKRVVIAISRGSSYEPGTPTAALEHLETYLRGVFRFIGIDSPEFVIAEGVQVSPEHREKALAAALLAAHSLPLA